MSIPPAGTDTTMLAQIFAKLGEMGLQLGIITEQLKAIPDHEQRIRALERFRWTVAGLTLAGGAVSSVFGWLLGRGRL